MLVFCQLKPLHHPIHIKQVWRVVLSSRVNFKKLTRTLLSFLVLPIAITSFVVAQTQKPNPQKPAKPRPEFTLQVSNEGLIGVSLKSENASLSRIAADLSRKLKVPVLVGRSVQTHEVTVDFKDLTLEPALHLLAPQVFVDYEINPAPGVPSRAVGIYLNGPEDPEPAVGALVPSKTETIMMEGHTEEEAPKVDENAPTIVYEPNSLTVSARKQPLSVILYRIAHEMHIPFELKWETSELIDVDIKKLPLEEAMPRLSPNVRLFVRANLQKFERQPFRMVLVRPKDAGPAGAE